ncbi:MAG TPA: integrase core domain-containing protein [Thermomicrobiales bacterium]|nr:integrase core domain-containing protein [Thermomicrobiales bacterium]
MIATPLKRLCHLARRFLAAARTRVTRWTRPAPIAVAAGAAADATRSRSALLLENALLRHQLVVLNRSVKRPRLTAADRGLLVLLASRLRAWTGALLIVRPETVLRWHRAGFRLFWRRKSRPRPSAKSRMAAETIALIREMAVANRLWGADRIRGELLKLDIRVSKRTIQRYLQQARPPGRSGQAWSAFLHNHAGEIWACDFLPVTDLFFRPLHAFFIIALGSRRVVHVGVTRHPTDAWVAQQLREATPFGEPPRFLIRDNDRKYGPRFDRLAAASGIRVLRTPVRAPLANATCERFLGSVRRECLDHMLVVSEAHPRRALHAYVAYFNGARPHQGIDQAIPARSGPVACAHVDRGRIVAFPVLGGLHHDYRRVA